MGDQSLSFLNHPVSAGEVSDLYQTLLLRAPESAAVIDSYTSRRILIRELLVNILRSQEFRLGTLGRIGDGYLANPLQSSIDISCSDTQREALLSAVRDVWSRYGKEEPHWSVMTNEGFRAEAFGAQVEENFYATGAAEIEVVMRNAAANRIELPVAGTALDFGCGVGRVGEHLSALFANYVGVDISSGHLALASQRLTQIGRENCRLARLSEWLECSDEYDFFYSVIVLQHNPPPVMAWLLDCILSRLKVGGVGFFQVPCALARYSFDVDSYLSESGDGVREMEMHALPQTVIFELLEKNGARAIQVTPDGRIGPIGQSYTFLVQRTR